MTISADDVQRARERDEEIREVIHDVDQSHIDLARLISEARADDTHYIALGFDSWDEYVTDLGPVVAQLGKVEQKDFALRLVAGGESVRTVGKLIGMSHETVSRWDRERRSAADEQPTVANVTDGDAATDTSAPSVANVTVHESPVTHGADGRDRVRAKMRKPPQPKRPRMNHYLDDLPALPGKVASAKLEDGSPAAAPADLYAVGQEFIRLSGLDDEHEPVENRSPDGIIDQLQDLFSGSAPADNTHRTGSKAVEVAFKAAFHAWRSRPVPAMLGAAVGDSEGAREESLAGSTGWSVSQVRQLKKGPSER